jgi:hypothetical protein
MNAGTEVDEGDTGNPIHWSRNGLCGQTIDGAVVECFGDLNNDCSDYSMAAYKSRNCRTYCPNYGDDQSCFYIDDGYFALRLTMVLVCDINR